METPVNPPPSPWQQPVQLSQRTLFPDTARLALAIAHVSLDDADRWHEKKWLSFRLRDVQQIDQPELFELFFIRNLARSGLSDEQIDALLSELPRPYRYDPSRTAYSFAHGWVQCPAVDDLHDLIAENVEEWIKEQGLLRERKRLTRLAGLIFNAMPDEKDEE